MRLVAANPQPLKLDDLAGAPSRPSFVPKVGGTLPIPGKHSGPIAPLQDTASTGRAGDARHLATPVEQQAARIAGAAKPLLKPFADFSCDRRKMMHSRTSA